MDFLTDVEPRKWDRNELVATTRSVVEMERPAEPREWFRAAYSLALALLMVGDAAAAADLMEKCIRDANDLAEVDPDAVELGVEAWLNRIELERTTGGDTAVVSALEASYSILTGETVAARHLFGLSISHMARTSQTVRARSLNAARNRVQSTLLKQLLRMGDRHGALEFAERVSRDFPGAVRHGMLEPVEVIAMLAPQHDLLKQYQPLQPTTEADFVVHLRTCTSSGHKGAGDDPQGCNFDRRLAAFESQHPFRNACTPWLWRVHHAMSGADETLQRSHVSTALSEAARLRDLRTHQRVAALASDRFEVDAGDAVFVDGSQPDRTVLVDLLQRFLAVSTSASARTTARNAQERASTAPCNP